MRYGSFWVLLLLLITRGEAASPDAGQAWTAGIIADHRAADRFDDIPPAAVQRAKSMFRISYGHTSHGGQIVTGMEVLASLDPLHAFNYSGSGGALSLHDHEPEGDLGNPDRVTWEQRTRELLDQAGNDRNFIIWSWCTQVSSATEEDIDTYLTLMNGLEQAYPGITFVYMTGHLDGSGEAGNLNVRNNQIRAFCRANRKILFDFADIESYNPDGEYFLDRGANDECEYDGGNWAIQWCGAHPASPLCLACDCAHSQPLNCNRKARAFWWLLARLAGWGGGRSLPWVDLLLP